MDHVAVEPGREHAGVLADVVTAAVLVDIKQCDDESPDHADTGVVTPAALEVRDHGRGYVEFVGEFGLCNVEVSARLPQGRPWVVAECEVDPPLSIFAARSSRAAAAKFETSAGWYDEGVSINDVFQRRTSLLNSNRHRGEDVNDASRWCRPADSPATGVNWNVMARPADHR